MSDNAAGWITFAERMPEPSFDSKNPDRPTHGKILVTNNISARNRWGKMSHVWLVDGVFRHEREEREGSRVYAEAGEVTAYNDLDQRIRGLSHWRPAMPEEWKEAAHA